MIVHAIVAGTGFVAGFAVHGMIQLAARVFSRGEISPSDVRLSDFGDDC